VLLDSIQTLSIQNKKLEEINKLQQQLDSLKAAE